MKGAISIKGLEKAYGSFKAVAGIDTEVAGGSFVSLLGPSGCGKTTTLRMLAGFTEPTSGSISVDGTPVSGPGSVVPPERRGMGMVFQSYAVWPHMTVFDNVAYGVRHGPQRIADKRRLSERVLETVELVGLTGQEGKYPSALSGGQQQRVALARAVISQPRILLLDEPLSNLDAKLRESMRFEIRDLQQRLGITTVFVTHSQDEALLLSDRVIVLKDGGIVEENDPERLYREPRTRFAADFVGLANFVEGRAVAAHPDGSVDVTTEHGIIRCHCHERPAENAPVTVLVRPESIEIAAAASSFEERLNRFHARVVETHFNGSIVDYIVAIGADGGSRQTYRVQAFAPRRYKPGDLVVLRIPDAGARLVN